MSKMIQITEICPTTTHSYVRQGATLVDVREHEEVAQLAFDIPKIIYIPFSEFEERYHELPKDKTLVIVCREGVRSLRAAAWLIYHGWDSAKVLNMKRGMVRWAQKGFPLHGDPASVLRGETVGCCGSSVDAKTRHNEATCWGGGQSTLVYY